MRDVMQRADNSASSDEVREENIERVIRLRDAAIGRIRLFGKRCEGQFLGVDRAALVAKHEGLTMAYINDIDSPPAVSLPYGYWHHVDIHLKGEGRVLHTYWDNKEAVDFSTYKPGFWEAFLLDRCRLLSMTHHQRRKIRHHGRRWVFDKRVRTSSHGGT
jgi:hypothetical protein